jgi:protein-S-isoprenylcysteine O-methyltransferase Ste14
MGTTSGILQRKSAGSVDSMKEKNGEHPFGDAGQLILLVFFLSVWGGDSFFLHKSTFLTDYLPLSLRLSILALTIAMALYLFKSGHVAVSHHNRPDNILTGGAFRYVRHPLYLASILTYCGLAISTASLFSLAFIAGAFIFYDYVAGYEERLLESKFGEKYANYRKRTGKWLPGINKINK